jgi:hypothetical protein
MGGVPSYLVLLRVGFAMPAALLSRRCALTAPFHPYPAHSRSPTRSREVPATGMLLPERARLPEWAGRYVFCGTFRPSGLNPMSRTLSGTLLCGVRTFLPAHSGDPAILAGARQNIPKLELLDRRNERGGRPVRLPTALLYAMRVMGHFRSMPWSS